jgi:hypothetical protein
MSLVVSRHDRDILRQLTEQQAEIASLGMQKEKAEMWRRLNQLEPVRPMVWINEIPWHEMNVTDELTLQTSDPWARKIELGLRRLLYQWKHMPGDMIVNDYLSCPLVIRSTGIGISEDVDIVITDDASDIVSRRFHAQIVEPEDIVKIKLPKVTFDQKTTIINYEKMCTVCVDILPVKKVGLKGTWFAPWDELIRWWGVQAAMTDMVDRPEMVNGMLSTCFHAMMIIPVLDRAGMVIPVNCQVKILTRSTCTLTTCGVVQLLRYSLRYPRKCTGTLPCDMSYVGWSDGV